MRPMSTFFDIQLSNSRKSVLSQYIFSANSQDKSMIRDGWIECETEEDLNALEIYKKI